MAFNEARDVTKGDLVSCEDYQTRGRISLVSLGGVEPSPSLQQEFPAPQPVLLDRR